jgi:hypothetical protein
MTRSVSRPVVVGRQQRFFEIPADAGLVLVWVVVALSEGLPVGLKYVWVLAIGLLHGTWVLRMRLQLRGGTLELPLVGPWRRSVDLDSLESIRWRHTGGAASKGTMFVRDRTGHRVPVYVGRFNGGEVWGKLLLDGAARSGATIDDHSRHLLEEATKATAGK